MRQLKMWAIAVVLMLALWGPAAPAHVAIVPGRTAAAQAQAGVYVEDFTTYAARDHTDHAEWDVWAHALRLAQSDGVPQYAPVVAVDGAGNALVVWEDERNGDGDIYAQRVDAAGNRLWAADLHVNSDGGTARQWVPAVALDEAGNALVVWYDYRNGDLDIYAQWVDAAGNRLWAADLRVNSESGAAWQWGPAVVVDGAGNALVVWEDERNGDWDVYAQRVDAAGNRLWAADLRVNSDGGTASQWRPAVALDGMGNALVVWQDARNGGWDVYAQRVDAAGNRLWAADLRVHSGGTADQWVPAVAVDGAGNALVVWQDCRDGDYDIYAQRVDRNGNRLWAADLCVSSGGTAAQWRPAVALDGAGNALVVWMDERNGDWDIYAQRVDAAGNRLWTTDLRVDSDGGTAWQRVPVMALDGAGNALVAWQDERNGDDDIYAQRVDAAGNRLWAADQRINSGSGTAWQEHPAVAADGAGRALMVWEDRRNGDRDIYAQRVDAAGNRLWAADLRVHSDGGTAWQGFPAVALDGESNALVVWYDYRNGDSDIYAQRVDAAGNRLWAADLRVNSDGGAADQVDPAVVLDGAGNALVVWEDKRSGDGDIYAQRVDRNGNRLWAADLRVNSDVGTAAQWVPAVALDGAGNALVVWTDRRNGDYDIYAQRVDVAGNRLWVADLRVNSDGGTAAQWYPTVALDGTGNALVVWTDGRNGDYDIYAQRVDAAGNRLWATDLRVNSDGGTAGQWYPVIAVDEAGNALVVWVDGRNGNWDIYAQRVDAAGNRLWAADQRVNSDGGTQVQDSPAMAAGGGDSAVVAWQDWRNRNADVYVQRVNSVGGKGWLADLQMVYPDQFYFPVGVAQSRTVDAVAGDIRQATLSAGYALNGGSVRFYLTNNGGRDWAPVTPGVAHAFTTPGSDLRWRAVLSSEPVERRRAPEVTSLRIEYTTQVSYADAYEEDDTCARARTIPTDGTVQVHTFHDQGDADWVRFNATSGTTYLIEAQIPVESAADVAAELYDRCDGEAQAGQDHAFTPGVRIQFQATADGPLYLKLTNHDPAVYGANVSYHLSVRALDDAPTPGAAVIVAGKMRDNDPLQPNIHHVTDAAYRFFRAQGYDGERIHYLATDLGLDADGDGMPDVDGLPTRENLQQAIAGWAVGRVGPDRPFTLYLMDHGRYDRFYLDGYTDWLAPDVLDGWLDALEGAVPRVEVNVIVEACHSGSFIDLVRTVSQEGRLVITSTGAWNLAWASAHGAVFSDSFLQALAGGMSLHASFEEARWAVQEAHPDQTPWLDDDGDGFSNVGGEAMGRGFGSAGTLGDGWAPWVV